MKAKQYEEQNIADWNARVALLEKQPQAQDQYKSLEGVLDAGNTRMLENYLIASSSSDARAR